MKKAEAKGTNDSILEASNFIYTTERNTGLKVECLEEIALLKGFLKKDDIKKSLNYLNKNLFRFLPAL